jgi:hypothetical protein
MKSTILFMVLFLVTVLTSYAQWTPNGENIYYNGGNVTIGATNSGNRLQIGPNPTGYIGNDLIVSNSNGSLAIHNDAAETYLYASRPISIRANGLYSVYAATSGNVGIGTSNPTNKLQIGSNPTGYNGNDLIVSNSNGSLAIHNDAAETYLYAPRPISIRVNGLYSIYAATSGNVGIGTSNPTNKLQIGPNPTGYNGNDLIVSNSNGSLAIHNDAAETYLYAPRPISIRVNGLYSIYAATSGNVGIGTATPDSKLTVKGDIHTREVRVDLTGAVAPDYVFEKDYSLLPLSELETYINQNKHLPEVPSAKQMEAEGLNLKEMNLLLLKKVEELTLHLIEQNKLIVQLKEQGSVSPDASEKKVEELMLHIVAQEKRIEKLERTNMKD